MKTAVEKGAGEYAIFNVANIREFVLGIDATAKITWRLDRFDPDAWLDGWVRERFPSRAAEVVATNAPAPKAGGDAFWTGLSDMHPRSLGRAATLHHLAAQRDGLSKALKGASSAASSLLTDEAAFLRGNLIHQAGIMVQTCEWLAQVETAAEALDRGDRAGCAAALTAAQAAFAEIPRPPKPTATGRGRTGIEAAKSSTSRRH